MEARAAPSLSKKGIELALFGRKPHKYKLNNVFVPGGQPTVTFVERSQLGVIEALKRAISSPNCIVSVTGATKSGKTVLVRNVLAQRQYVLVEGGQCKTQQAVFDRIASELNVPVEETIFEQDDLAGSASVEVSGEVNVGVAKMGLAITPSGSQVKTSGKHRKYRINNTTTALRYLIEENVALIIDDFHYIDDTERASLIRSLKGAVFQGLKVILLSVGFRAYEALNAEREMTGRLKRVDVPDWDSSDLQLIARKGLRCLHCSMSDDNIVNLAEEANGSPLLMQQFCWELALNANVEETQDREMVLDDNISFSNVYRQVAADCGQPIYERLVAGPQSRTDRMLRPLRSGGSVDIYQALFMSLAHAGPKSQMTYEEIRASLSEVLADNIPQKHEVSNALKHVSRIAEESIDGIPPLEWDDERRTLFIQDPFLRFYLKWVTP